MTPWLSALIPIMVALITSSGFWAYMQKGRDRDDAKTKLLLGLAHDSIIRQGMTFLERGWVTKDEFEDFDKYLYKPYSTFGGNGLADKIASEVRKLPMHSNSNRLLQRHPDEKRALDGSE